MMVPTVHLNGTASEDLIEQLCDVSRALAEAIAVMQKAAPNGRDYYPQGPEAIKKALAEHAARLEMVDAVQREIEMLAERIEEQD